MARARPSAAFNSSTAPHASTRGCDLGTRRPNINAVVPESPVLVTMLIQFPTILFLILILILVLVLEDL
jgi:hypothetical protein